MPTLPEPIDWADFWSKDHTSEDWTIEPLLPRGRQVALYSPAKVGKSLLALDVCARAATGQAIFDQVLPAPLEIVYLDLEMTETDLFERLDDMGYGPETDLSHFHYYLLPSLPPLDTKQGGATLMEIVKRDKPDLVVIDTTSRVISGPENDADTLRNLYQHTGLLLKQRGITVWRLDHAGKDVKNGQRGTSAKNDDVDLVWELSGQETAFRLKATHRRQSWVPELVHLVREDMPFRHEIVQQIWPSGTQNLVRLLEELDINQSLGAKSVRKLLREAGHGARNETISAAIRWRKMQAGTPGDTLGTPSESVSGTPAGTPT